MIPVFATTLFTSALLLFWVQPMVAKLLLPLLGGTPMVWNTCLVFFQAVLLAGYAYAHFLTTRCSTRTQAAIHVLLLALALVCLPISLPGNAAPPWNSNPTCWLLRTLLVLVGLPFFTLSASSPLLQSWFTRTRHTAAGDPYFLYAASNAGSLVGLLAYPLVLEPSLRLRDQTWLWTAVYVGLIGLVGVCGWAAAKREKSAAAHHSSRRGSTGVSALPRQPITWLRRGRWILWAFIPSSLMLAVTSYLTTDIASVPLLWVVPLGLYLGTMAVAFAPRLQLSSAGLARALPIAAVALVFLQLSEIRNPAWVVVLLHLGFFSLVALLFHTQLAADRPPGLFLTDFYFCLSLGGVLGGVFNSLLAPLLFRSVFEYPLVLVLACLAWRPSQGRGQAESTDESAAPLSSARRFPPAHACWRLVGPALAIGLLAWTLARLVPGLGWGPRGCAALVFGLPLLLCYLTSRQPLRFGLALGALLLASPAYIAVHGHTLHAERNFFGALKITQDPAGRFYRLYHGTTLHGLQFITPERQGEPLAYFHRAGPCGQFMTAFNGRPNSHQIAVIGLGAGTLAAYARPGQHWTFYEIDPAVVRLARDTNWFSYLRRCHSASTRFQVGDARLRLQEAAPQQFDLIVADAFGSDVPPLHLLTREALQLYLSKLAPQGLLLFQVSSRYFDFRPVLGNLADHFQLQAFAFYDTDVSEAEAEQGRCASFWVTMARRTEDYGPLLKDHRWHPVPPTPGMRLWTDDFSNILDVFHWFQ